MLEGSLSESSSALHPDFGRDVCTHHKVLFLLSKGCLDRSFENGKIWLRRLGMMVAELVNAK